MIEKCAPDGLTGRIQTGPGAMRSFVYVYVKSGRDMKGRKRRGFS